MSDLKWQTELKRTVDVWVSGNEAVKRAAFDSLQSQIKSAYDRGVTHGRGLGTAPLPGEPLTERQLELARLAAEGRTNAEIAQRLHITENSVKTILRFTFKKIGASSRTHLASILVAHGQAMPRED